MDNITFEVILTRMLNRVKENNPLVDTREGSIIYDACAPAAYEVLGMYIEAQRIFDETYADTASRECLIKRVKERGIIPSEATHAVLKGVFTPSNIEVSIGTRFSLGKMNYTVIQKIGDGTYQLECETEGEIGNKSLGTLVPIDYVDGLATAELTELLIPGENEESDNSIRKRYFQTLSAEAYGGNKQDYLIKTSLIKGVGGVKVYSGTEWNGGGTVKIVITDSNYQKPTKILVETVQEQLDPVVHHGEGIGIAPIGHIVTVVGVNEQTINVELFPTYNKGYDWSDVEISVKEAITNYLKELNSGWHDETNVIVRISQIENRLLNVQGIIDVARTRINGVEENFTAHKDSIVIVGDVVGN